jgi:hypothetical protein
LFHPGTWFRILKNSEYIGTVKNAVAEKKQSVLRSAAQRRKAQYSPQYKLFVRGHHGPFASWLTLHA